MADFIDSEAEESEEEEELDLNERRKLKKMKAVQDSSEEEEDDEDKWREELKDLIDDNPIEEDVSDVDTDGSDGVKKRKKHDEDDDLDDRLEDDDYDLIEENLGVKVERKRFKRLRRIEDEESDDEGEIVDEGMAREAIADQLFDEDDDNIERRSVRDNREQADVFEEEDEEDSESDADDFIVDDDGRPIAEKRKKRRPIFTDASLQEGQDIFGVDFDYDDFARYEEDEYEDEYEGEEYAGQHKKISKKKMKKGATIFDVYEPSELKRGHFTDLDNQIRKTDIPERMQTRSVPVTPTKPGSTELDDEAEWIFKQAFNKSSISQQQPQQQDEEDFDNLSGKKPASTTVPKIKQVLGFIRNENFDVPFIVWYRKEYIKPELDTNDIWTIYYQDERWCQLYSRKNKLNILLEKMRTYQMNCLMNDTDKPLPDDIRIIKDEDFERLREVQTMEELKDIHMHFLLYYSHDIPKMQEESRQRERDKRRMAREAELQKRIEEGIESEEAEIQALSDDNEDNAAQEAEQLKQAKDTGPYAMCRKAGICGFAKRFGLQPEQYAENLRDSYQRHDVDQESVSMYDIAKQFLCPKFMTLDEVIHAGKFVVARQISREPLLRRAVREVFFERAKINVRPTKKGIKEIDENHMCYGMKYLSAKPVRDLVGEEFLRLHMAEEDKLIEITIIENIEGITSGSYIDEAKSLYQRDEFSKVVQEWNGLRAECVELALKKMVIPDMCKELRAQLLSEAKQAVLKSCTNKLSKWLSVMPYQPDFITDIDDVEDNDEWKISRGIRVIGMAYVPDYAEAAFCAAVDSESQCTDFLKLPHILKRKNSYRSDEKLQKMADLNILKEFIRHQKPHVIVIGGESREAVMLQADVKELVQELNMEEQFPEISVEILDNELAKIYANSKKGAQDYREYPILLKQAISLARKMQDPLIEYSQLCGDEEEILCLRYHTLQEQLDKEELLEQLYREFIDRVNEVGLDINIALQTGRNINLIQFVAGLGPRKCHAIMKLLRVRHTRLENRTQLVTICDLGAKVFVNCSGFFKIDTSVLGDTDAYVEILDSSRIHPETYEWARKMAIDAVENEDDPTTSPAGALEEILKNPDRLKDLDLDAFAVELERQGFGNKTITLYDIRTELYGLYKDLRKPFRSPTAEELFDMLTKETPESFFVGKMILVSVTGISYRKPQGEQLDQANPVRNDETGNWQCPFCMKDDFPELSEVWNHFDAGACPGQATGIKLRLDNGLSGFIHIKNLSDKHVKNPEERVRIGQAIHVRIIKIDVDRFSVDCSSKSSDLLDKSHEWRPRRDQFYDYDAEEKDNRKETEKKAVRAQQQYVKRVIIHPSFHNKSYAEVVKIMENMDQGEVVVRPSSKGSDHLTVTWKVTDDIYQHIDVREEGKENAFSLGQSLWIGNQEFEDLDEIIARHVHPMAACVRELLAYKYYRDTSGGMKDKMEELLKEEKLKDPKKIHYFISASKTYPGKFLLSYLPKTKIRHEYVSVVPEGFRFRGQVFDNLNSFLKWFKDHYSDPIPTNTPMSTPHIQASIRTSGGYDTPRGNGSSIAGSDIAPRSSTSASSLMGPPATAAAMHATPHYANQTPSGGYQGGYVNTPYTPSGQTPFMTPYSTTPHGTQTPRYMHSSTPSPSSSASSNHNNFSGRPSSMKPSHAGPLPHSYAKNSMGAGGMYPGVSPRYAAATGGAGGGGAGSNLPPADSYRRGGGGAYAASNNNSHKESMEWQMAADSWARPRKQANHSNASGNGMPPPSSTNSGSVRMQNNNNYGMPSNNMLDGSYGGTPNQYQSDNERHSHQRMYAKDNYVRSSPRSVRSTPRTNTSPHSMNLGDATPLYDEN